jgi:hypothetical protein
MNAQGEGRLKGWTSFDAFGERIMRSERVFGALAQVSNRFLLAKLAAKATRIFHRPNSRIPETLDEVLVRFSNANPIADASENAVRPVRRAKDGARQARRTPRNQSATASGN